MVFVLGKSLRFGVAHWVLDAFCFPWVTPSEQLLKIYARQSASCFERLFESVVDDWVDIPRLAALHDFQFTSNHCLILSAELGHGEVEWVLGILKFFELVCQSVQVWQTIEAPISVTT